jgi:Bacterial regulatory helix-turn-helix protein, lysR family
MKQNFTVRQGALGGVEAFLSVAQHRSFRRAAAELGLTPSAISQAVRALEGRVGAALFLRTTRSERRGHGAMGAVGGFGSPAVSRYF